MNEKPRRGSIALCSRGMLGLITHDAPQEVTYGDGTKAVAYIGVHLRDTGPISSLLGSRWSSREPRVIGHISQLDLSLCTLELLDAKKHEDELLALT